MFIAIYSFTVVPGKEAEFKEAWVELTKLIYQFENSLGSRLHHEKDEVYIAYAQWRSKEQWANSGGNLPEEANQWRQQMKAACSEIKTVYELEVVDDLLASNV
ncbi:antibiotic biosynthesis monooxygenase [Paracrocinitomix mangrovi]|uniref:antibiotic biosynthesis monooxygenase family protein n=1 Tax=Paracrocinitomix mangrovi TaxID=2862509 RepID=UPI001C8D5805|nr:antibiotic biosynthesis monooxygenase [Paracrocinitomix mangrovi]UKN00700.1 antibiotic biosynthesis monooxygenase [Paracrocinitomix mangrovi]